MERLSETFARLAQRMTHPDKKVILPMQHLEQIFRLNDPAFVQNTYFQTMVDYSLGINDMNRPCLTRVYQSHPGAKVSVTIAADDNFANSESEVRTFPASALIACTEFRLHMLTPKRGIGIMIRPRLQKATDDIDVAFGFYGIHDPRDGNVMVKKILMLDPRSDKTIRPHLREDTVVRALEFAGLCVEQLFQKKTMDLNGNMHMAITLQGDELTPRWKAGQKGQSPQPWVVAQFESK